MKPKKSQMYSHTTLGIFAMIVSSLCFSLMNMCVKFLHDLSPMEIIFFDLSLWWGFWHAFGSISPQTKKQRKKEACQSFFFAR